MAGIVFDPKTVTVALRTIGIDACPYDAHRVTVKSPVLGAPDVMLEPSPVAAVVDVTVDGGGDNVVARLPLGEHVGLTAWRVAELYSRAADWA